MRATGGALAACLAAGLAGCASIERYAAREEVEVVEDVAYVPGSANPKHRLDLFLPRGRAGFPVVLFVHGGYWRAGDRSYFSGLTGLYGGVGLALARRGIAAAVTSYRLAPEVPVEGQLEDVARALRWTADALPARGAGPALFLMGHSAGGHLALLLAADPRWPEAAGVERARLRGVVALSPVVDVAHMTASQGAEFAEEVTARTFGRDPERWKELSPVTHFSAAMPPVLLALGAQDYPYLTVQVHAAAERLRKVGASVELHELSGASHADLVLMMGGRKDRVTPLVERFVRRLP